MAPLAVTPTIEAQHQQLCVLPGLPTSAGVARTWSSQLMNVWGLKDDVQADATLGLSELVTNAAVHGRCEVVALRLALLGDRVRVEVREWLMPGGPATSPALTRPDEGSESGRGLWLVTALSLEWGWTRPVPDSGNGSCVWALFGQPQ